MRSTASFDSRGSYCGRAARGVSNLSSEHFREIEAHRAKARPTPWAHLAQRYGVNEVDLRGLMGATNDNATQPPEPEPLAPGNALPGLWAAGLSITQISNILNIDARSVQRIRKRLNLPTRTRADL